MARLRLGRRLWLKIAFIAYIICNIIQIIMTEIPQNFQVLIPLDIDFPTDIIEKNTINIDGIFSYGRRNILEKKTFENINNALLLNMIRRAKFEGAQAWKELNFVAPTPSKNYSNVTSSKVCPSSISTSGKALHVSRIWFFPLPCGLVFGSAITITGKPQPAQLKYNPLIGKEGEVSQFFIEVQGFKLEENEKQPPTLFHLNPRLHGDWTGQPVIEHNSRYGQDQWGKAHRCEGREHDEKVDNLPKCEKWLQGEDDQLLPISAKKSWWHGKTSHSEKEKLEWKYPLVEGHDFSFIIQAGIEGFHVTIDGRHISSFPYQAGFSVEEATGIVVGGDIDVDFVTVTSLPQDDMWKALPKPNREVEIFVGIMSSSDNFAERMAIRKTWFQSKSIQSLQVVPRFFVALHKNKDINLQLKEEAGYYGDIIILHFIDRYDIVVLKTLEIFKFGVHNITAKYIMKCDDDTFIRIDGILEEVQEKAIPQGLYMGNMNEGHWPLRDGKWAVNVEEWPNEQKYPTYANGPGYILSKDIVHFILEKNKKHKLQLFKMEDVNVGIWAYQFAKEKHPIKYVDIKRFAQDHCENNYLCVHYQSPRQMMCLWDKLLATNEGRCCYY